MEVKVTKPEFAKFDVTFTVESEEDARALYAIFNHLRNAMLFPVAVRTSVIEQLGDRYYARYGEMITRNVSHSNFYED